MSSSSAFSAGLPFGLPFPFPTLFTPASEGAEPMPTNFAPVSVLCMSADPLFYAFRRSRVDSAGAIVDAEFYNHATGAWEADFLDASHVKPMTRVAASGSPNGKYQEFAVPWGVASDRGCVLLGYTRGASGDLVEWGFPGGGSTATLGIGVQ